VRTKPEAWSPPTIDSPIPKKQRPLALEDQRASINSLAIQTSDTPTTIKSKPNTRLSSKAVIVDAVSNGDQAGGTPSA
jgi:hypothetical protein